MPTAPTPPALLADALARDPGRPLVTWYDPPTGERVELSVATFDTWVAKTANLLVDELLAEPGDRVAVRLPLHWQTAVWVAACWAAGTVPVLGDDPGAAVHVVGPRVPEPLPGGEVVALSLRPLGGRFAEPLPGGVLDYAAAVPGHGDRFAGPVAAPGDDALVVAGRALTHAEVVEAAREHAARWGLTDGGRLLTALAPTDVAGAVALLPAALAVGGSVVLTGAPLPEQTATAERVSAVAG